MSGHRIRVGFDGRALTSPAAGVRRYARRLIEALVALDDPVQLVLLGGDPSVVVPPGVERVPEAWHPPTNAGWMLVGLPRAIRRGRVDLLHAPAYTAPFWCGVPMVLTIHDVSYARHPEWFPYRRDWLRRAFYRRCALGADWVLTDSEFSKAEIHAAYGIAPARIIVAPLGVDPSFAPPGAGTDALPAGLSLPFLLHVGDLHERRNLAMMTRAVLAVRRRSRALASLSLVLAGVDRGVGQALRGIARDAGAEDAVVLLDTVSEATLRVLYQQALALAYPSLYEGFGLPILEAMACGTPVLASRAASIPEVVGDAGVLLDPHDEDAWADACVRLGEDADFRDALRARGLARAAACTWERTARQTLDVYRVALNASPATTRAATRS